MENLEKDDILMYCNNCGKQIPDGSTFCSSCGTKLNEEISENNSQSRVPAQLREISFRAIGRKVSGDLYISIDDMVYTVPYKRINSFTAKATPTGHIIQVSTSKSNLKLRDMANMSMNLADTNILGGLGSLVAYSTGLASKALSSVTDKDDNICYVDLEHNEKSVVIIKTNFFLGISLDTEE